MVAAGLFCVFSCGKDKDVVGEEKENRVFNGRQYYRRARGLDVYVKKFKGGCTLLVLESYEKGAFVRAFRQGQHPYVGYKRLQVKNPNDFCPDLFDVEGTKLRIFEAIFFNFPDGVCVPFHIDGVTGAVRLYKIRKRR